MCLRILQRHLILALEKKEKPAARRASFFEMYSLRAYLRMEKTVSIIISIPDFDAGLYWAYCLSCKDPMFGVEQE